MKRRKMRKREHSSSSSASSSSSSSPSWERKSAAGSSSFLCRLIDSGTVSDLEPVFYLKKRDGSVMREGKLTRDGVLCACCGEYFHMSRFEIHAESTLRRPSANIFLGDGRSLMQCLQSMESSRPRPKLCGSRSKEEDDNDGNDNICQICGDGGRLMLCDSCPAAFHAECLHLDKVPKGEWHCLSCRCGQCGKGNHKDDSSSSSLMVKSKMLICAQCHVIYHAECSQLSISQDPQGNWFCKKQCRYGFKNLRSLVGHVFPLKEGLAWLLLRSSKEDEAPKVMVKDGAAIDNAEERLSEALQVLRECFDPIIDHETKVDLLPQAVFNRRSDTRRLDCRGFYTMMLMLQHEREEELVSVATIRIHGNILAEMPFVGTRTAFRQRGMCKFLMNALELMLTEMGICRFILPSLPQLIGTWTRSFGFQLMDGEELTTVSGMVLMSFPGTKFLHKTLVKHGSTIKRNREIASSIAFSRRAQPGHVQVVPPNKAANNSQPICCH